MSAATSKSAKTAESVRDDCPLYEAATVGVVEYKLSPGLLDLLRVGRIAEMIDPASGEPRPELVELIMECPLVHVNEAATAGLDAPDAEFAMEVLGPFLREHVDGITTQIARALAGLETEPVSRTVRVVSGKSKAWVIHVRLSDRCPAVAPRIVITALDVTEHERTVQNLIAHREQLEVTVERQREELQETRTNLNATSELILSIVAAMDRPTAQSLRDTSEIAAAIATEMRLDEQVVSDVRNAGLVYDIGKLAMPVELLTRAGELSELETNLMHEHVTTGRGVLERAGFSEEIVRIVSQHHERWDGSGYPLGLKGEEIDVGARILGLADSIAAMIRSRPYRAAASTAEVLTELMGQSGTLYCPECIDALKPRNK